MAVRGVRFAVERVAGMAGCHALLPPPPLRSKLTRAVRIARPCAPLP